MSGYRVLLLALSLVILTGSPWVWGGGCNGKHQNKPEWEEGFELLYLNPGAGAEKVKQVPIDHEVIVAYKTSDVGAAHKLEIYADRQTVGLHESTKIWQRTETAVFAPPWAVVEHVAQLASGMAASYDLYNQAG